MGDILKFWLVVIVTCCRDDVSVNLCRIILLCRRWLGSPLFMSYSCSIVTLPPPMASGQLLWNLELYPESVEREHQAMVLSVNLLIVRRIVQQLA